MDPWGGICGARRAVTRCKALIPPLRKQSTQHSIPHLPKGDCQSQKASATIPRGGKEKVRVHTWFDMISYDHVLLEA